jgi:spoIIIJ-associated protein
MAGINEKSVEEVIKQIKELLDKLSVEADTNAKIEESQGAESVLVDIRTPDANLLIGSEGTTLSAFQYLARIILKKKSGQMINFVIDVNNYKKKKEQYLIDLAKETAFKVKSTKEEIVLQPMSSYERRIIHMTLAEDEEIATESTGEGPERKVVIKLKAKK